MPEIPENEDLDFGDVLDSEYEPYEPSPYNGDYYEDDGE